MIYDNNHTAFEKFMAEENIRMARHAHRLAASIMRHNPLVTDCKSEASDLLRAVCFQKIFVPEDMIAKIIKTTETLLIADEQYDPDVLPPEVGVADDNLLPFWEDTIAEDKPCEYLQTIVKVATMMVKDKGLPVCVPCTYPSIDPITGKNMTCYQLNLCKNRCIFYQNEYSKS